MRRLARIISVPLLCIMFFLGMHTTVLAADSTIVFQGAQEGFSIQPGSEYTATDLFDNFKNIMPGDKLVENINIKNQATDCDYINLYMRALVFDENNNPLTYSEAFESLDGKDQAGLDGTRDETVATMQDFLSQLTMRIYNGSELIYEASPNQAGALLNNVFLGSLSNGEELKLVAELDVPIELGNAYANRVGEVCWVFLAECIEYEKLTVQKVWEDNGYPDRPGQVLVDLLRDGREYDQITLNKENQWTYTWDDLDDRYQWSVKEQVPQGYDVSYKTEDNKVFIINHKEYEPQSPAEPRDLTVKKVWSDEENRRGLRPGHITVSLYHGIEAVDKVTLDASNSWTYTWTGLSGEGQWSVIETGIPKGYVPSYCMDGEVITITNTASLIQTGQLNWPILVLGSLGAAMILLGIIIIGKKKKDENI